MSGDRGYRGPRFRTNVGIVDSIRRTSYDNERSTQIFEVHSHPVLESHRAPTTHLPNAGQSGQHGQPPSLPRFALQRFFDRQRPRADQRHVADQHVPKLRHFVQARPPQDPADPRRARIVPHLEGRPVLHAVGPQLRPGSCARPTHIDRSLYMRNRRPPMPSRSCVKNDRSRRRQLDDHSDHQQERQRRDQSQRCADHVDGPLDHRRRLHEQRIEVGRSSSLSGCSWTLARLVDCSAVPLPGRRRLRNSVARADGVDVANVAGDFPGAGLRRLRQQRRDAAVRQIARRVGQPQPAAQQPRELDDSRGDCERSAGSSIARIDNCERFRSARIRSRVTSARNSTFAQ